MPLTALTADETPSRRQPSAQSCTACRQLWGPAALPPGTAGASRIACMGAELAARQLRAAAHRMAIVDSLLTGLTPQECADPMTGRSYRRMLDSRQQTAEWVHAPTNASASRCAAGPRPPPARPRLRRGSS
ncbi:hypothetical protein GCM10018966_056170 [Streptomyces yanii]